MANNNVTLEEQIVINANEAIKAIDTLKKSIKGLKTETGSTGSVVKDAFSLGTLVKGGKRLLNFLSRANSDAMDLIETTNLFEVSFGKGIDGLNKYYEKAIKFQNQLSEALGTNINESMNFQALFNSMGTSMGLDREVAYKISENFTKLGYDLASLYNTETDKAMQKLQSGLSGSSTRPLRSFGIDITQSTLASTLTDLGLDTTISKLNQAEKMVLRYIAVLRQSTVAHGDFARTLESPANQLRIFQAQCLAFRQNIGSLWQGIYAKWMPYINGILMAINALIRAIGSLFGIKFGTSMQSASKSLKAGASGAGGIASGLKDASGSAKDLKEELDLMPWDEIHNIELPDKTSSSGGGGASGGGGGGGMEVDPALVNAMGEYDNMMDKVRNKATDIRDKIMEWLGFTKKINPFTNEISWEYTGMSESARKILNLLKAIVAVGIASKIVKFAGKLMTLKDVLAGTVKPTTEFQRGLVGIAGGLKHAFIETVAWGQNGILTFKQTYEATGKVSKSLVAMGKDLWALVPVAVKVTAGIAGLGLSFASLYSTSKKMSETNEYTVGSFAKLAVGMGGAIASGAVLGSVVMPGVGTAIGAVAGGVVGLTGALFGWQTEADKMISTSKKSREENEKYLETIKQEKEAIQDSINSQMAYVEYVEDLVGELDTLVDAEGNVKAGMEDRVKFILTQLNSAMGTEYELIDGQVQGYKDLAGSIQGVIEKKKAEIILNANEQAYTDAITRQMEIQKKRNDAQIRYNEQQAKLKDLYQQIVDIQTDGTLLDHGYAIGLMHEYNKLSDEFANTKAELEGFSTQIVEDNQTIMNYEDLMTATITGDAQQIEDAKNKLMDTYNTTSDSIVTTVLSNITKEVDGYEYLKTRSGEIDDEIYNHKAQKYDESLDKLAQTLVDTTKEVGANEPEIVEAWRQLANNSEERYNEYISLLPGETQDAIDNAIAEIDGKQPRAKQAGADVAGSTIQGAENRVNDQQNGIAKIAKFIIDGLVLGVTSTGPLGMLLNAGRTMMDKLFQGAQERAEIGSPSKAMFRFGDFLVQGLANGVKANTSIAVNAMKDTMGKTLNEANKFVNGVNVNPSEYSIDTNKFIDYGSVSGSISSQIDVTDSISNRVYQAVMDGLQSSTINVDIEAKTEEGILLKKVQNQARQYRMQTGKAPFPTM